MFISSFANPKIKEAIKLREGKHRRRSRLFLIDGLREIDRALKTGIRLREIFTVLSTVTIRDTPTYQVTESIMQKISFGDRNEGIVAVAEEPEQTLEIFETKIDQKTCPLLIVLEGIEKPGNLGAVFRSADAAGIDGIMIADPIVDPFHANAIHSSTGAVFSMPTVSSSTDTIVRWLQDRKFQIAAAWCSSTATPYTAVDFCQPTAIVLGCEAAGLTTTWNGSNVKTMGIPMLGIADSLNVSVAAAILCYEAQRQRILNLTETRL